MHGPGHQGTVVEYVPDCWEQTEEEIADQAADRHWCLQDAILTVSEVDKLPEARYQEQLNQADRYIGQGNWLHSVLKDTKHGDS